MDIYRLCGLDGPHSLKTEADVERARQRVKKRWKELNNNIRNNPLDAKHLEKAWEQVLYKFRNPPEEVLGRSRMDRLRDRMFTHQGKEIQQQKADIDKNRQQQMMMQSRKFQRGGPVGSLATQSQSHGQAAREQYRRMQQARLIQQQVAIQQQVNQPVPTQPKPNTVQMLQKVMKSMILVRHKFVKAIPMLLKWVDELLEFDTRCHALQAVQDLIETNYCCKHVEVSHIVEKIILKMAELNPDFLDKNPIIKGLWLEVIVVHCRLQQADDTFALNKCLGSLNKFIDGSLMGGDEEWKVESISLNDNRIESEPNESNDFSALNDLKEGRYGKKPGPGTEAEQDKPEVLYTYQWTGFSGAVIDREEVYEKLNLNHDKSCNLRQLQQQQRINMILNDNVNDHQTETCLLSLVCGSPEEEADGDIGGDENEDELDLDDDLTGGIAKKRIRELNDDIDTDNLDIIKNDVKRSKREQEQESDKIESDDEEEDDLFGPAIRAAKEKAGAVKVAVKGPSDSDSVVASANQTSSSSSSINANGNGIEKNDIASVDTASKLIQQDTNIIPEPILTESVQSAANFNTNTNTINAAATITSQSESPEVQLDRFSLAAPTPSPIGSSGSNEDSEFQKPKTNIPMTYEYNPSGPRHLYLPPSIPYQKRCLRLQVILLLESLSEIREKKPFLKSLIDPFFLNVFQKRLSLGFDTQSLMKLEDLQAKIKKNQMQSNKMRDVGVVHSNAMKSQNPVVDARGLGGTGGEWGSANGF